VIASDLRVALRSGDRVRGLLRSAALAPGQALVINRAHQVHSFGMSYPLDVIFCDRRWRVSRVIRGMEPRRVSPWVMSAHFVVELLGGTLDSELTAGMTLSLSSDP
jgi:uncharacterized membrane protein (UPF0127 family)